MSGRSPKGRLASSRGASSALGLSHSAITVSIVIFDASIVAEAHRVDE
jgi:hypothetical protein